MRDMKFRGQAFGTLAAMLALVSILMAPSTSEAQTARSNQMAGREHEQKGNYYLGRNMFEEAIQEYEKALDLDPGNTVARDNIVLTHNNKGALFFRQKKYDEAMGEWQKALQLDPYCKLAKNNIAILKATMARQGIQPASKEGGDDKKASAEKSGKPGSPPPSAVMILTPGVKSSGGSSSAGSESASEESSSETAAGSQPEAPAETAPAAPATPPPLPQTAPGGSLEDQISALEIKIYGHKEAGMTVLKRLEKMETDTAGQVRLGTIKDRIEYLKKNYGL